MTRGQSESEGTMRIINDALLVIEFDPEGNVIKANQNFLQTMGYKQEEIAGEHHRLFVTKDERGSEAYRNFWKDIGNGRTNKGEYRELRNVEKRFG
jgi:methyl-accepting chemotaxis protein